MDSPDDIDVDTELDAWLIKQAAEEGIDLTDPYGNEPDLIASWQQNPTPEGFELLFNTHEKLISRASAQYVGSTTLPKAAVRGFALQRYAHALQTFDPNRGAQFKTHLYREMQRLGRYTAKYSNVARIGSEDLAGAGMIPLLRETQTALQDKFGRMPTDNELADEMLLATEDVASMQKLRGKINLKNIGSLRRRLHDDFTMEQAGGAAEVSGDSEYRRKAIFLHGSLNPEQQLVLEHTFEGFGKPVIEDDVQLAQQLTLSPQKVRAIKAQIRKKIERTF